MKISIRKASIQDCTAICEIHVSSIWELGKSHYTEDQIASWSGGGTPDRYEKYINGKHLIVAENNSIPIGFGTFDLATGELIQLYISPDYTGKGVGIQILNEFFDKARAANLTQIYGDSSLNAEGFYANADFEPGQRKHWFSDDNSMDCIPMNKLKINTIQNSFLQPTAS